MSDGNAMRVSRPPARPLLLFDDDCHFCRRWVERWAEQTGDAVEYRPYQDAAREFPEIPEAEFERAVQLVEPDGSVWSGAAAVARTLAHSPRRGGKWALAIYSKVGAARAVADSGYAFIAKRRRLASAATRLLWGDDVRRPTFTAARDWFLRALGVVYLIAFVSLRVQIDGLIGERGILPIAKYLGLARDQLGANATRVLPTLCWFNASDAFLHASCNAGAVLALLLIAGVAPLIVLPLLFVAYLSLAIAGQAFLSFQWDILLLEAGFLAIFLAPARWSMWREHAEPPRAAMFLLKLLLFKLMWMSGVVKLTSGDESWWDLTALDFHYWTQPLPTVGGWWADQGPEWMKKATVAATMFVEIVLPFFIWAPRRLRNIAAVVLLALQAGIAITGNYGFFNLLTAALCLLLFDDRTFRRANLKAAQPWRAPRYAAIAVLCVTLPFNAMLLRSPIWPEAPWPRIVGATYDWVESYRIVNGYGLFRVMTKTRPEIVIEGSMDGLEWTPYEFRWKPGDVRAAPRWVAPYQPRLDWQMWFAALGTYRRNPWFVALMERLLQNSEPVTGLLARNPFADAPPRYVRAISYEYRFTTAAERRATGNWWKRGEGVEYLRPVSLADFER